jgi:hypothetical protein
MTKKNVDVLEDTLHFCLGDDLTFGISNTAHKNFTLSEFCLLSEKFGNIFYKYTTHTSGIVVEYSGVGIDKAAFLGSLWVGGIPFRNLTAMITAICIPMYSTGPRVPDINSFLLSRIIEVGGNSGNCSKLFTEFGFNINEVAGKTVSILVYNTDHDGTFSIKRIPYVIPNSLYGLDNI